MPHPALVPQGSASAASELLAVLVDGRPRSRAEIGQLTGWARKTVEARVNALVDLGFVQPTSSQSTGGRPSALFALDAGARVVLAADLGHTHCALAVTDLLGEVLTSHREEVDIEQGPEVTLDWVLAAAADLLESIGRVPADVAAVGIGLPSPVRFESGRPLNPVGMKDWSNYDVPAKLHAVYAVPVLVDNDVNLMAYGEWKRHHPDVTDMMFIKVATGVGAGVIAGGSLQRGSRGIAGDIGHVPIPAGLGIPCACGNVGCLSMVAAIPAIAAEARRAGAEIAADRDLLRLVEAGDVHAIQALRQAGRAIGEVLVGAVSLLNPSLIVVGGPWAGSVEHLIAGIREVVYGRTLPISTERLDVVPARAGGNAATIGAAALAIEKALSAETLAGLS